MKAFFVLFLLTVSAASFAMKETPVQEADIVKCEKNSDCIIVPFKSCCGSTKKAINKKYFSLYKKTPAWQKFDDPHTCAVAGACISDKEVKEAECNGGHCILKFPEN